MKTKLIFLLLSFLCLNLFAQTYLVNDNFEDDTLGTLPDGWVIRYEGTNSAHQIIVDSPVKNGIHSFQVSGSSGWAANLHKSVADIPNQVTLEGWMRAENVTSGGRCGLGIGNPSIGSWGAYTARVEFYNGNLITYHYTGNTGGYGTQYVLEAATPNTWYHVKIETNTVVETYKVFINGVEASSTIEETTITEFPLLTTVSPTSVELYGNSMIYFDDIKLYKTPNLVAYYPFNGNANDESGNGNNGTVNGATLTTDRFGNTDSAYSFDGNDDYILCNTQVGPFGTDSRTVSFWAKTDRDPVSTSQQNAVLSYGQWPTGGGRFEILLNPKCRGLGVDVSSNYITKTFDNSDNDWHFYTVVFDNSISNALSDIQFYADGTLLTSVCNTNGDIDLNTLDEQVLNIGRLFYTGQPRYFKGSIDEIKIFNSVLSDTQILDIYNIESSLSINEFSTKKESNFYISNNTLHFKSVQNLNDIKSIEVYNLLGQKVFKTSKIEEEIKLENLREGIYIAKVNTSNSYQTMKFIVN